MIVSELIEKLKSCDPNMRVLGRGYESGCDDLDIVEVIDVYHHPNNSWYEGEYQNNDFDSEGKEQLTIVYIN